MADSKTYLPEEITTEPFPAPGDELVNAGSATVAAGKEDQQLSPATTGVNKKFPERVIAHQTISESLNTKEKKILGNYQFGPQGAIQVGKYVSGTSGDIKITPDGVTARNSTGDTTFALDGTTGDATFKGTIEAADFIIADENGLISVNNFPFGSVAFSAFTTTSATYVDITDATITTENFSRARNVLLLATTDIYGDRDGAGDYEGEADITFDIDGTDSYSMRMRQKDVAGESTADITTISMHYITSLSSGIHTIKLQMLKINLGVGNFRAAISGGTLSYITLGT